MLPRYGIELFNRPTHHLVYICFTGRSVDKIKTDVQEKGDIGIVAEVSFKLLL